jgi:hypothetical protein
MEENKNHNRGGVRPGAGRKKRDEEASVIELLDKVIDKELVAQELLKRIKAGDSRAMTLYMNYRFGKPTQTINQTTTLSVNDVDISELISFKKPDSDNE